MSKQQITFKDWLKRRFPGMEITRAQPKGSVAAVMMEALEESWDTSAIIEREECAKIAEAHFIPGHAVAGPAFAAECAKKIRGRGRK